MKSELKRSNAPIFWGLFGAGGMLAALFGPMLVVITGVAVPLGWLPAKTMGYQHILNLARNLIGKGLIWALITLLLWHAAHRIYHSLHDIGIQDGPLAKLLTYGIAMAGTVITLVALLVMGF